MRSSSNATHRSNDLWRSARCSRTSGAPSKGIVSARSRRGSAPSSSTRSISRPGASRCRRRRENHRHVVGERRRARAPAVLRSPADEGAPRRSETRGRAPAHRRVAVPRGQGERRGRRRGRAANGDEPGVSREPPVHARVLPADDRASIRRGSAARVEPARDVPRRDERERRGARVGAQLRNAFFGAFEGVSREITLCGALFGSVPPSTGSLTQVRREVAGEGADAIAVRVVVAPARVDHPTRGAAVMARVVHRAMDVVVTRLTGPRVRPNQRAAR